jgi:glycosyltransferase involved in cell wall biosynthesis
MTRISVGLPVYNGERYLRQALDSIVTQTHADLEIIISDNASTDATTEICQEYAAHDPRIRYFRQDVNRGGAYNHNFVLAQATAPYFRLFSHDDWLLPTCLEKCAKALDEHPDVVLAWTETTMVDARDQPMDYRTDQPFDNRSPSTRLASLLVPVGVDSLLAWCAPHLGVGRLEVFTATFPLRPYGGSDYELTVKLALRGPWIRIDEPLFMRRQHEENSSTGITIHEMAAWMVPAGRPGRSLPNFRRRLGYLQGVLQTPMSRRERLRCLAVVLRVLARPRELRTLIWDSRVLAKELMGDLVRLRMGRPADRTQGDPADEDQAPTARSASRPPEGNGPRESTKSRNSLSASRST